MLKLNQEVKRTETLSELNSWSCHQMEFFRVTDPLWGESTGHRWIPLTKANDGFDVFIYLRLN